MSDIQGTPAEEQPEEGTEFVDRRKRQRRMTDVLLAKLIVTGMAVQLLVIGYVFITEFHGRQDAISAARQGCERDKLDREASVTLNEAVQGIFRESEKKVKQVASPARDALIDVLEETTKGLDERSKIDCNTQYPKPSLFP